jgi:ribose transport system permease protein
MNVVKKSNTSVATVLRALLPTIALSGLLCAVFWHQPRAMSYFGINLLLNLAIPIVFATMAQMMVLAVSDLDLSIGAFVSLVASIVATRMPDTPWIALGMLAIAVLAYALAGAIIEWRKVPSIVVTLGLSFVWLGSAVLLLPTPGGLAPEWLSSVVRWKSPLVPLPIWIAIVAALFGYWLISRSAFGSVVRGLGGNPSAVARAGWSLIRLRAVVYGIAAIFGVIAGMLLVGQTTSADANIASRYTLMSIAAVILGGGEFVGGRVSPIGAVLGALTMTLAASFLTFLNIAADWQLGIQGVILIIVLGLRSAVDRLESRR